MKKFVAKNIEDLKNIVPQIINIIENRKIVCFYGEMGSGKTTMISTICQFLGTKSIVNSPTFSIINDYEINGKSILHFDLYRLKNKNELHDLGFEDYLESDNFCFIEWPQIAEDFFPPNICIIKITINTDNSRSIEIN